VSLQLAEQEGTFPFRVPAEPLAAAFAYVAEWREVAEGADEFEWESDVDATLALQLVRYWHNLSRAMLELAERGEVERLDPVAEQFAEPLLRALLDGLVDAGLLDVDVADRMWREWPRLSGDALRPGDGDVAQHEGDAGGAPR
jgi:hypothetical protein